VAPVGISESENIDVVAVAGCHILHAQYWLCVLELRSLGCGNRSRRRAARHAGSCPRAANYARDFLDHACDTRTVLYDAHQTAHAALILESSMNFPHASVCDDITRIVLADLAACNNQ